MFARRQSYGDDLMTDVELAEAIQANLIDAEARMEAADVDGRVIRRFRRHHAGLADIALDLKGAGHIQTFSGGEPKTTP